MPVQAARRRWSSCSTTWPCCQLLLSGQPALRRSWGLYTRCVHSPGLAGMEGATDSSLGLLGFVLPQVLALTSCLRLPGCKGSIRLPLGAGRGCTCTPWVEAPWHAQGGTGRDLALIPHPTWLQEARMSRAAEVMVQHVENLKRHHLREHAELEEMKRLIQQNSRNRQLAETQGEVGSATGAWAGFAQSCPAGFGPEPLWGVSVVTSQWWELRAREQLMGWGREQLMTVVRGQGDSR